MDKNYNKAQSTAILHNKGPALILAGPGSGKTLVITQRTKYLIEEYGVNPSKILVITFTKAAATEMKERFLKIIGDSKTAVNFGTFHAVFFTILKYAYHFNANNIIREDQKYQYFKEIIEKLDFEVEDEKEFISGIESEISLVKGEQMDLEHYYSINCSEEIFKKIYTEYETKLRKANLIDFDDMLVLCYELLVKREDILKIWQEKYEYILIDEFQDINKIQYNIIKLLAKPQNNIFIVGDDDQSIYRFRGAKPEIMLNFEKDYIGTKKVLLDINYRSTKKIVEGAKRVISHNKNRFSKNIGTINEEGHDIKLDSFKELSEENKAVVEEILRLAKEGVKLSDIAILFRTNTQPRSLLEKFMEYNIPFRMKDSIPNIYDHFIAKNLIDYIKIALGNRDRALFLQIMNRPKRYLSRDSFREPYVDFESLKDYYSDKQWMFDRIAKLEYDLTLLKDMVPYSAINYIRKGIGYEEYLKEYATYRRIKVCELIEVLDEIQESSKNYKTYEEWFAHIEEYKIELCEQITKKKRDDVDSVSMMTFHSSKGLEFEVVFIVDANEGITPHQKALTEAEIEEERRMFYVAMTRAKKRLYIYSVKERYNKEFDCSRFVGELLLDLSALKEGVRISHKMYGEGKIIKVEENRLNIKFDRILLPKKLDTEFCIRNHMLQMITND